MEPGRCSSQFQGESRDETQLWIRRWGILKWLCSWKFSWLWGNSVEPLPYKTESARLYTRIILNCYHTSTTYRVRNWLSWNNKKKCNADEYTIDRASCSHEAKFFPYLGKNSLKGRLVSLELAWLFYMGVARVSVYYISLFKFIFPGRFYKHFTPNFRSLYLSPKAGKTNPRNSAHHLQYLYAGTLEQYRLELGGGVQNLWIF